MQEACTVSFNKQNYSALIASTGQAAAQAPQSAQASLSITNFVSPSEMQPTGHSEAQEPHWMHSSLITYAMGKTPPSI